MNLKLNGYSGELSPEALALLSEFIPKHKKMEEKVKKIPVAVLIWGASPNSISSLSQVRLELRTILRENGHLAMFSEEMCNEESGLTLRTQQLMQAKQFDVIISIPGPHGSIAEIHDFTSDVRINKKILLFLDRNYEDGYSHKSLFAVSNVLGCKIILYKDENDYETIINKSLEEIQNIREYKYLFEGRYSI